jgi:tRNA uridine 5-carboxymethylaminomethyl modification enzyme
MKYDVIVVGAGHAGVEAAETARRLGKKTALMTFSKNDIAQLPCNVSIGGSAKGILVREIFALGGIMPVAADNTQLQTKVLNTSKGPAVRALRAQVDKVKYPEWLKNYVINSDIDILEGEVTELVIENNKVTGVIQDGKTFETESVILATGTFLDSKVLIGDELKSEGPDGNKTNTTISKQLREIGHTTIRLKTGTPPRIKIDSIDLGVQIEEPGSDKPIYFSEKKYVDKEYENIMA